MPDEYVFVAVFHNKMTREDRKVSIHIYAKCEHEAFNRCVTELYKNIREHEWLGKIELIYVIDILDKVEIIAINEREDDDTD